MDLSSLVSSLCARLFLLPPQKCLRVWLRVAVCSQHVEMSIHCQCNCYLGIQFCLTLQILLLKRIYLAWKKSRFIFQNIQPHYLHISIYAQLLLPSFAVSLQIIQGQRRERLPAEDLGLILPVTRILSITMFTVLQRIAECTTGRWKHRFNQAVICSPNW